MNTVPVWVHDDFAPDLDEVRGRVIAGGFKTEVGPDGAAYTGISQLAVPQWEARISELLGLAIAPRLSFFRLNLAGEYPHSWVHSDDICAQFASVLYLNPAERCKGGTAFWRHKALGFDHLLSRAELEARGYPPDEFYKLINREWRVLDAWEQIHMVDMRFGRFLTYPTSYFHSRFPFEGFGRGPADGRLIWVCFFDRG